MKSPYYSFLFSLTLPWFLPGDSYAQFNAINEQEELILVDQTSSLFEMVFYPTQDRFDDSATRKVATVIKNQLLQSSVYSKSFPLIHSINILVKGVNFEERHEYKEKPVYSDINYFASYTPASLLRFEITMNFDMHDESFILPSQFDVDKFIIRIFSQPSTKTAFIDLVTQTLDPFLVNIEDVDIIFKGSYEKVTDKRDISLSTIDIILIVASSLMSIGIFSLLASRYHGNGHEQISEQSSAKGIKLAPIKASGDCLKFTCSVDSESNEKFRSGLETMMHVEGNIIETGSIESSIESQSQIVLSVIDESPVMSFASSSRYGFISSSDSSTLTDISSKKNRTNVFMHACAFEKVDESIDPGKVKFTNRQYSNALPNFKDSLTFKLLNLPGSTDYTKNLKPRIIHSSSVSAPAILADMAIYKKPDNSCRSMGSQQYWKQSNGQKLSSRKALATSRNNHPFMVNGLLSLEILEEFHNCWLESKMKALEDIEEGSVDDVFRIDFQQNIDTLVEKEATSNASSSTSVLEWMKLIRVVESASEAQSSCESSLISHGSLQEREIYSTDFSLEDSLAKSLVDPDTN